MSGYLAVWDLGRKIALVVAPLTTLQGRAESRGYMEKMVLPGAGNYVRMRAPVTNGLGSAARTRRTELEPCDCRQVEPVLMKGVVQCALLEGVL